LRRNPGAQEVRQIQECPLFDEFTAQSRRRKALQARTHRFMGIRRFTAVR
jgi:hypothetical protein